MPIKETRSSLTEETTRAPFSTKISGIERETPSTTRQWTIKGLNNETVDVSREAARRSGMKLNAWISQALESAAHQSPSSEILINESNRDLHAENENDVQNLKRELDQLRADNEAMKKTVKLINDIILKLVSDRI